jgi:glycosyltransferase involved in cell wall biosynthesis
MKILFIIPGSGDSFYCGNCFRDNLNANALRKAGHDIIIMPLYLPLKQKSFKADTPLFFPALTAYVTQKFFKRKGMPRIFKKIMNLDFMLKIAASFSGSTSAEGMEDLTMSMIHGDEVVFNEQVNDLTEWIKNHETPDIIHLSSSLIIGIAKALKKQFKIPIVCSLQDEEIWVESLKKEYVTAAWKGISDNIKYIDQFIASSEYYKQTALAKIPSIKNIKVIYPGVNTENYFSENYPDNPVIGFFYRMNQLNGLDILAKAFIKLKKKDTVKNLRLKIAGGYTAVDKRFLKRVRKILSPYFKYVDWDNTYNPDEHASFYRQITVISVPITFNEGAGFYICEAFAAGRPAVEPATGSFNEIVGNAGILYSPNNSESLAEALEKILTDNALFLQYRENALCMSKKRYNDIILSETLLEMYREFIC